MSKINNHKFFVRVLGGFFALSIAVLGAIFSAAPVSAASLEDTIVEKAALEGLYNCYRNGNLKETITTSNYGGTIISNDGDTRTSLPFGRGDNLTCSQLLNGTGSSGGSLQTYGGLLKSAGVTMPGLTSSPSTIGQFLTDMGYNEPTNATKEGRCATYTYASSNTSLLNNQTIKMCVPKVEGDKIVGLNGFSILEQTNFPDGNKIVYMDAVGDSSVRFCTGKFQTNCTEFIRVGGAGGIKSWSELTTTVLAQLDDLKSRGTKDVNGVDVTFNLAPNVDRESYGDSQYILGNRLGGKSGAADKAIDFLSGGQYNSHTKLALTDDEKVFQLQQQLNDGMDMDVYGCQLSSDEKAIAESRGYKLVHLYRESAWQVCYAKPKSASDQEEFDKVVSELDQLYGTEITNPGAVDESNTGGGNSGGSGGSGDAGGLAACYDNAGALGWIVCPVFSAAGDVTNSLYGYIEDSFLQVGTNLASDASVREGWGIFRDFTNILFVIAFLVVILSQITGIGVSNYGVKKLLPRLIMIAVLVNISFLLCQLAIDLSNIVGAGSNSLFRGLASRVAGDAAFDFTDVLGSIITAAFAVGATATILSVTSIVIPWNIWLFPIFLTIIGCLVSVFFFLILLGVRQAGIILLMVISPIAIICYALPNTKSFFDRWRKLFSSLLLVYPICGLMMGGGQFASTLLLKAGGGGEAGAIFVIVALLVAVVPFFFIPSILKASMTAMGNLGMKVTQFGRGISGGITRGIRGSEIGRDIQRRANMAYFDRAAAKIERKAKRLGGVDNLSRRQRTRLGRYNASYNRLGFEELRAGGSETRIKPGTTVYDAMAENMRAEQFDKDISGKQNLIKNGGFNSIISTGSNVNGNNDDDLGKELDEYLNRIINAKALGYSDEQVDEYVKSAQAIINTLSDRGTSGARTKVMNSISQAMNSNAAALTGASREELKRLTRTFGSLASRISGKYGKLYKGDNPGSAAMLSDIAKGDFRHAGTFKMAKDFDIDGNVKGTHLRSTEYSKKGLDGINEEDFSKLKTSGLSNILAGIQDGDISGGELQEVARLSNEVLNSDIYKPDGDARKYMEWIRDAAFASSAGAGTGRTAGSGIISSADSRALNSIFDQVQGAKDWGSLTAEQQQHFGQLMSNINESLAHDAFEASDAAQLKQTLKIAHSKGFQDSTGQVVQEFTGSPTLKIPRNGAGSTKQKISLPSGWAQMPDGRWIEMTSSGTRDLTPAEIRKAEQIETHNNQVDIDNGTV